jgi:sulfoxide reductase heme-binding subunit YedZ
MFRTILYSPWTKATVFLACLVPGSLLVRRLFTGDLGPNPVETLTHGTGDWTIYFILITLCITPLRKILKQPVLIRFRKMLGLFAFFYGVLHFSVYMVFDHFFDFVAIVADVIERPYITAGFLGYVLMIPLAITSTKGMIRRLGGKRWQRLHRLIYVSATAGVVHYYWLVKSDITVPLRLAVILAILFLLRLWFWVRERREKISGRPTGKRSEATAT